LTEALSGGESLPLVDEILPGDRQIVRRGAQDSIQPAVDPEPPKASEWPQTKDLICPFQRNLARE